MMKYRELTTGRKAAVVAGDVILFGAVILQLCIPSVSPATMMGVGCVGFAIQLLASMKATQEHAA